MDPNRLIELVREFAAIHGQNISEKLFLNLSGVPPQEITQHFSTWQTLRSAAGLPPKHSPPRTTQADVLAAFQTALKKHGPRLTLRRFSAESGISERVIYARCGNWTQLRLSAGLTPRANSCQPRATPTRAANSRQPVTHEQILDHLRAVVREHGEHVSLHRFCLLTGFSQSCIDARFGRWSKLRSAAGLPPIHSQSPISEADVIAAFQTALKTHGPRLSLQTFSLESGISERVIYSRCGSWTKLRLSAGLPPRANIGQPKSARSHADHVKPHVTPAQILDRLRAIIREHGENIAFTRFCKLTQYSQRTVVTRFGSWSNLRRAAGLEPYARTPARFTRDQLLDDLLQVYHRSGADPRPYSYRFHGGQVSTITIRVHFGSWPNAIAAMHDYRLTTPSAPPAPASTPANPA